MLTVASNSTPTTLLHALAVHCASVYSAMDARAGTVAANWPFASIVKLHGVSPKPCASATATHAAPAHAPSTTAVGPFAASQYVPAGSPASNVAVHAASPLLIATKPAVPRANAICWDAGDTQFVSGALPTAFRKPTIAPTDLRAPGVSARALVHVCARRACAGRSSLSRCRRCLRLLRVSGDVAALQRRHAAVGCAVASAGKVVAGKDSRGAVRVRQ